MNVIKIESAYQLNYRAEVLNALKQKWSDNSCFDCSMQKRYKKTRKNSL